MQTRTRVVVVSTHLSGRVPIKPMLDPARYEVTPVLLDEAALALETAPADLVIAEAGTLAETLAFLRDLQQTCNAPCIALVPTPTSIDHEIAGQADVLPPRTQVLFPPIDGFSVHLIVSTARQHQGAFAPPTPAK